MSYKGDGSRSLVTSFLTVVLLCRIEISALNQNPKKNQSSEAHTYSNGSSSMQNFNQNCEVQSVSFRSQVISVAQSTNYCHKSVGKLANISVKVILTINKQ